ncbi:MAG: hypothetical protein ABI835_01000 [Chloroflexota bacterium]
MRNNRVLIVLLMVFVVLATVLVTQNSQISDDPPTLARMANVVFRDFTPDDIQAIRLRSPESGETFVISRATDGTRVWTAPESAGTLISAEAENIARTIVLLPVSDTIALPQGDDLATFGFTPEGVLSVEIVLSSGVSHAVAVGYRTPTDDNYYAIVDDSSEMYLIFRPPIDYLISRLKSPPVA